MFLAEMLIGGALILATFIIHAFTLDRLMVALELWGPHVYQYVQKLWKIPMLLLTVAGVFCAHIAQIWLWAFLYLFLHALPNLEEALYFSTVSFTTVGFGDVVLSQEWRLLGAFQAANGFILFGWSTAFIFEVMSKLYKGESIRKHEKS